MQIATGKVVDGRVVIDADLPEGAEVTLLALDGEETFEVDAELEAVLLESIAQGERGETIAAAGASYLKQASSNSTLNRTWTRVHAG